MVALATASLWVVLTTTWESNSMESRYSKHLFEITTAASTVIYSVNPFFLPHTQAQ